VSRSDGSFPYRFHIHDRLTFKRSRVEVGSGERFGYQLGIGKRSGHHLGIGIVQMLGVREKTSRHYVLDEIALAEKNVLHLVLNRFMGQRWKTSDIIITPIHLQRGTLDGTEDFVAQYIPAVSTDGVPELCR
jgi:hypothetical protein